MPIRVEHQPSPGVVGMAAYAAGRGKYLQRQQAQALGLARDQQRLSAYGQRQKYQAARGAAIQRDPFGGQAVGQQAAGEWVDPLVAAQTPADRMVIKAQRRENARAQRMGKDVVHPGVDPFFKSAPTKEEIRRQQELEDRKWGVENEERINIRERQEEIANRDWKSRKEKMEMIVDSLPTVPAGAKVSLQDQRDLLAMQAKIKKAAALVEFADDGQTEVLDAMVDSYMKKFENLEQAPPSEEEVAAAEQQKVENEYKANVEKRAAGEDVRKNEELALKIYGITYAEKPPADAEKAMEKIREELRKLQGTSGEAGGGEAGGGEAPPPPSQETPPPSRRAPGAPTAIEEELRADWEREQMGPPMEDPFAESFAAERAGAATAVAAGIVTKDGVQYRDQPGKGYVQVSQPAGLQRLIAAARAGNKRAQQVLDEREVQWQQ